jgi:hypothetical protein
MRKALVIVGALVLTLFPAQVVYGFGATRFIGQSHEHEKITRGILTEFEARTLDQFAGKLGYWGAIAAPDRLFDTLAGRDYAHCDNGDYLAPAPGKTYPQSPTVAQSKLQTCRQWIFRQMDAALTEAKPLSNPDAMNTALNCKFRGVAVGGAGSEKCRVLMAMGQAMHAAQDFYAHSNWTDEHDASQPVGVKNPPGLNRRGKAPYLDPRSPGGAPPAGLISGCFNGTPEWLRCRGRIKHSYLNKDMGEVLPNGSVIRRTARGAVGANFLNAWTAASEDTADKWAYFKEQAVARYGPVDGRTIICAVTHDDFRSCRDI